MVVITTSRKPSQRTRSFVNDLARILSIKILNRGKSPLGDILSEYDKLIVVEEYKGNPGKIKFYDIAKNKIISILISAKLQREVCEEETTNVEGKISMEFMENAKKYQKLFYDFFSGFGIVDDNSSFKMRFEGSLSDKNIFYIQFYENDKKIGPLIIVKSLKLLEID
ncbi:Brix domain-containing protein [Methanothermococcus okinawensis]|uniref:Probable Brix domain-containing ribosomal biogenesis protein n=1 Tax=Methanothermococcus okinawensis (strain DSM 14208 / JCM 11175 / IH1) TaxID=647113 RepID=F8ANR7_METOI|nr:hypothetical protein [Methanothermococcus okinawensis]AEH06265.1 brix domain-containing ribosomal biogenesis protein [Methanothermococcus okinawensis IH1]